MIRLDMPLGRQAQVTGRVVKMGFLILSLTMQPGVFGPWTTPSVILILTVAVATQQNIRLLQLRHQARGFLLIRILPATTWV